MKHAMRVQDNHNTPVGSADEIKAAVKEAIASGNYTEDARGVITGRATIQGVNHEFTGYRNNAGQIIFSNIYKN